VVAETMLREIDQCGRADVPAILWPKDRGLLFVHSHRRGNNAYWMYSAGIPAGLIWMNFMTAASSRVSATRPRVLQGGARMPKLCAHEKAPYVLGSWRGRRSCAGTGSPRGAIFSIFDGQFTKAGRCYWSRATFNTSLSPGVAAPFFKTTAAREAFWTAVRNSKLLCDVPIG